MIAKANTICNKNYSVQEIGCCLILFANRDLERCCEEKHLLFGSRWCGINSVCLSDKCLQCCGTGESRLRPVNFIKKEAVTFQSDLRLQLLTLSNNNQYIFFVKIRSSVWNAFFHWDTTIIFWLAPGANLHSVLHIDKWIKDDRLVYIELRADVNHGDKSWVMQEVFAITMYKKELDT